MEPKMVVLIDGAPSAQSSAGNSDNEDVRMTASASQPSLALSSGSGGGGLATKDSRWLTLEVCREFQRGKCTRSEQDCKFAHPPPYVEVNNGKVVACFDNLKGRCQRVSPPCKYLHPPQHLKDILQQNGRNNLILRSLQLSMAGNVQLSGASTTPTPLLAANGAMGGGTAFLATSLGGIATGTAAPANSGQAAFLHSLTPGTAPVQFAYAAAPTALAAMIAGQNPSPLTAAHAGPTFVALNPTYATAGIPVNFQNPPSQPIFEPTGFHTAFLQNQAAGTPTAATFIPSYVTVRPPQTTAIRTDRLEVCKDFQQGVCPFSGASCQFAHPPAHCPVDRDGLVTVCVDYVKGKCTRDSCKYFHPPDHLVAQLKALSSHHQGSNVCAASGYPAVFCSAFNPAVSAVASQRVVTAMMLGGSTTPSLHHSAALPTNMLSAGSLLVAQRGSPAAPPTAFFPGATHILTGTGPSLQARPTIIASNPTQQFISALQPNQIDGMLHCYQPASAGSNCVVSTASVQTVIPQPIVDTNEPVTKPQGSKSGSPAFSLKQDYDVAQQLPSVEQYTQTAASNNTGQAQYVGMTTNGKRRSRHGNSRNSAIPEYTTGIE